MEPYRGENFSQTTRQSEEQLFKIFKDWHKFWKQHKYVPAAKIDQLNSFQEETSSYQFTLMNIDNLSEKIDQGQHLGIKIYGNCFSKSLKKFFGRSLESNFIPLELDENKNQWVIKDPGSFSIYYHTKVDHNKDCVITLEVYLFVTKSQDVVVNTRSLGYATINIHAKKQAEDFSEETAFLRSGTPRELISQDRDGGKVDKKFSIKFSLKQSDYFDQVKHLVPESCLIGTNEELPGLQSPFKLPYPINGQQDNIYPDNRGQIYISNIKVYVPESIKNTITDQISQQQQQEGVVITFKERRLCCSLHNGWTLVNSKGMDNSVQLQQREKREQQDGPNVYEYRSDMNLQLDKTFAHKYGLIIFQLEDIYQIQRNGPKTLETRVLGYLPKPIIEVLGKSMEIKLETIITGKGKTVDGKRINDIGRGDVQISFNIDATKNAEANLRTQKAGGAGEVDFGKTFQSDMYNKNRDEDDRWRQEDEKRRREEEIERELDRRDRERREERDRERYSPDRTQQNQSNVVYQSGVPQEDMNKIYEEIDRQREDIKQQFRYQREDKKNQDDQLKRLEQMMMDLKVNQQQFQQTIQSGQNFYPGGGQSQHPRGQAFRDDEDYEQNRRYQTRNQQERVAQDYQNVSYVRPNKEQNEAYVSGGGYDNRDITDGDLTYLQSQGVQGLLDTYEQTQYDNVSDDKIFEKELKDRFKTNIIQVKFLAIKPKLEEILQQNQRGTVFNEDFCIPERLRFSMNFYDFPKFETDTISYEEAGNTKVLNRKLQNRDQIVLMREQFLLGHSDQRDPAYKFVVDPSQKKYKNAHRKFVDYLNRKSLHIDIWDDDTQFLYGTIRIPLAPLLRKQMEEIKVAKEYEILDPHKNRIKGSLQLLIINTGTECADNSINQREAGNQTIEVRSGQFKKKIKSNGPIQIPSDFTMLKNNNKFKDEISEHPEERKKQRILKFKQQQLREAITGQKSHQTATDMNRKDESKKRLLEEINAYKQSKKSQYVKDVLSEFLKDEIIQPCFFGQQEIISKTFENTTGKKAHFRISIVDPDDQFLEDKKEIELISKESEWKYHCERRGEPRPAGGYGCITEGCVSLKADEKITLLFKLLTYRKIDHQMIGVENPEAFTADQSDSYRKEYINERTIKIFITSTQNKGTSTEGFKLRVVPYQQIVDHMFRYYERENRDLKILLPKLYHDVAPPRHKPHIITTYEGAKIQQASGDRISINVRSLPAKRILRFNVLAYKDPNLTEFIGNWVIEVHSLKGLDLSKITMGKAQNFQLPIDSDCDRTVKFYSSHPYLIQFKERDQQPRLIQKNKRESVNAIARCYEETERQVQVNCIDVNTKEIVLSWIVSLETDAPTFSRSYSIECAVKEDNYYHFQYQNRGDFNTFRFESSDPNILRIPEPLVAIDKARTQKIKIIFPKKDSAGQAAAYVFVQDEEDKNFEVLLFQIRYQYGDNR